MTAPIWQDIDTAPHSVEVEVRAGSMRFPAMLVLDGSMDSLETTCDQWQATTDRFPRNWCDGCCWESNSEGVASTQPNAWRPLMIAQPPAPQSPKDVL